MNFYVVFFLILGASLYQIQHQKHVPQVLKPSFLASSYYCNDDLDVYCIGHFIKHGGTERGERGEVPAPNDSWPDHPK